MVDPDPITPGMSQREIKQKAYLHVFIAKEFLEETDSDSAQTAVQEAEQILETDLKDDN